MSEWEKRLESKSGAARTEEEGAADEPKAEEEPKKKRGLFGRKKKN